MYTSQSLGAVVAVVVVFREYSDKWARIIIIPARARAHTHTRDTLQIKT